MKLLFAGDLVLDREVKYSKDFLDLISEHDHRVVNLEAPFIGNGSRIFKAGRWINSKEEHVSSLRNAFDCVTLANNHMMDYGNNSLLHTLDVLNKNNFKHCGAGSNNKDAHEPIELDGCYIFSVAENEFGCSTESSSGISCFDDILLLYENIKKYSELGKIIICYHGGTEVIPIPPKYLRKRFSLLKSFGADLIIGHHPHVVQGFDEKCFYSLGNFYFVDQNTSKYENIDWSLIVSYDTETDEIKTYHTTVIDDTLTITEKQKEIQFLNEILHSKDYDSLSDIISLILYDKWYKNFTQTGPEVILHYLRCDAHKENISKSLSHMIKEFYINDLENYKISVKDIDFIEIEKV